MTNLPRWLRAGLAFAGLLLLAPVAAPAQTLPQFSAAPHLGVVTCGGSTCHGADQPSRNSNVLQNEATIWAAKDKHARAYKVLLEPRSAQIARKLGLPNASTAQVCLNCHADNVPPDKRGRQFDLASGVACDACHGAGTPWLGIHISGASHQDNVKAGLYPTDDPVARAKLCLSCHIGSQAGKFVTHRIMGAGHPRMPFELATFTAKQPAHYVVDQDYIQRKGRPNGMQVWAIGQALQLDELMSAYVDPKRNPAGPYPELVFFDCAACHHPMSAPRWQPSATSVAAGVGPGVVVFNDANALMLRLAAERVDPALGRAIGEAMQGLRHSVTQNREASLRQATRLRDLSRQLVDRLAGHSFGPEDVRAMAAAIVNAGLERNEYVEHSAAEQAAEALEALSLAMRDMGGMSPAQAQVAAAEAAKLKETTVHEGSFDPAVFTAALREYKQRVAFGR